MNSDTDGRQVFLYFSALVFFSSILSLKVSQPEQKLKAKSIHLFFSNNILVTWTAIPL
jgi:hypothetical protein